VKKLGTLVVATGILLALAGCASDADTSQNSDLAEGEGLCQPGGSEIDSVEFAGTFGATPEVNFEAPLEISRTQRLVVIEGDGELVENGDDVIIGYTILNGATGEVLEAYDESDTNVFPLDTNSPILTGVSLTVACSTIGSRVAGLIPAEEGFGPDGAPQFGLNPGEPILFIADLVGINPPILDRVEGEALEPSDIFPTVEYGEDGTPSVSFPEDFEIPSEYILETLIVGTGAEVSAGDIAIIEYHGVNWTTGEVFDSTWLLGRVARFPVGNLITGFQDALIGQTVGSRVIVSIPPELGYGPVGGQAAADIGPDDTIMFLIDILGRQ
jgi:peptidylprolyl isomerase